MVKARTSAFLKRRLQWEEPLNALLGTMFGAGFATNNNLAEPARNVGGVLAEIVVVVIILLLLLSLMRLGALALADRRWRLGLVLVTAPAALIGSFAASRARYATYGDVLLLAVLLVWVIAYLLLGLSSGIARPRPAAAASGSEPESTG